MSRKNEDPNRYMVHTLRCVYVYIYMCIYKHAHTSISYTRILHSGPKAQDKGAFHELWLVGSCTAKGGTPRTKIPGTVAPCITHHDLGLGEKGALLLVKSGP